MKVYKRGEYFECGEAVMRATDDLGISDDQIIAGDATEVLRFGEHCTRAERLKVLNSLQKTGGSWGRR